MSNVLVLFGATGQTGRHVLPLALDAGFDVRAFVRSPEKIPEAHRASSRVEVVQGTFEDGPAVEAALEGAQVAVVTGGGPSTYRAGMMLGLTEHIAAGMRTWKVPRLVYQAGALSHAPNTPSPLFVRALMRPIMGPLAGMEGMLKENDRIMAWLAAEASDLDWTVTRPGQITEGPSKGRLEPSDRLGDASRFVDLAALTVRLAASSEERHRFPYVRYAAR